MKHLHPSIREVIAAAGYDLADPSSVRRFQAHYDRPGVSPRDLAILARRLEHDSDLTHARTEGRHRRPSASAIELDRIILRAIAPHLTQTTDWHTWHTAGEPMQLIAARAGVDPVIVRLALHGITGRTHDPTRLAALERAARSWRAGQPLSVVAADLERSTSWLRQALKSGRLTLYPKRLHRADIAARAGVDTGRVRSWETADQLPAPAGHDVHPWWWEPVITDWLQTTLTHHCPHCPVHLPTQIGLRVHITKTHHQASPPQGP